MLLAGFGGLIYWANQPEYAVLYSDLSQKSAGSVVNRLEQQGVPYKLVSGGTMIQVPAGQVSRLRLSLAKEGVPKAGRKGYSLFDQRDVVGMSSFAQRLNYQRALEGELQRTIKGLAQVKDSRVHLVMPEKALFEEEQKPPTASVALDLGNADSLDDATVEGVANLVASAVEGLDTAQVTVVDQAGKVLNGKDKDQQKKTGPGEELLSYQRGIERQLEKELSSLVERVVGNGKAEIRVNAAINDEKVQLHEENYDPFSKAPRSKKVRTRVNQDGAEASGTAGAAANVPGGGEEQESGSATRSNYKEEVVNYEISKTVRDVLRPGGGIERLSVAVLVGGKEAAGPQEGQGEFVPRGQEQLDSIRDLVAGAAGIDPERGDTVTVRSMPLEGGQAAQAQTALGETDWWEIYMLAARYGGYALVTFLVLWFAVRPLMRYLSQARPHMQGLPEPAYAGLEGPDQGGEKALQSPSAQYRDEQLQELDRKRQEMEEMAEAEEERREHVRDMVHKRQDNAATVIRQWMRE
jgi:flagellar M-ring protein FliF